MKVRFGSLAIPILLAALTGALYLPRLDDVPIHLTPDEVFSGLTAHSVATTGRDLNGRFMPLYFQLPAPPFVTRMWYQPILMYAITAGVKALPFSERTIRLPMTLAAVLNVVLMFYVARVLFRSELLATAAALFFAATPAHFINSRVAMDFHAPLPFILAWLLCLLIYLERDKPMYLVASGAFLGVGLYSYIASYLFMPAYLLATGAVLYLRREPRSRYLALAAGFLMPGLLWLPFLLTHPTVVSDTLWRYQRDKPQGDTVALARTFLSWQRLTSAASLYWGFVKPGFLFVNGPRMMWGAGVFLLPAAGLLPAGLWRTLSQRDGISLVLLFGLLIAPLPASIVDEPEAVHRAAVGLPFAVLLAVAALDYMRSASPTVARAVFFGLWTTVIGLAVTYHDALVGAQALVRASTIPIAVTGLAVLLPSVRTDRVSNARPALAGVAAIVCVHAAYFVPYAATIVGVTLAAVVGFALFVDESQGFTERHPAAAVALLAAIASHALFVYVDYAQIHRVGPVPASAIVLGLRLIFSALALAVVIALVSRLTGTVVTRLGETGLFVIVSVGMIVAAAAYFAVDAFADYRMRLLQVTMVLGLTASVAALIRTSSLRREKLWHVALAGLVGVASLQFTAFYRGYFAGPMAQQNVDDESKARAAFETVIARVSGRDNPTIYLGTIGPYAVGELYWRFYLVKHHREDLLARTVADLRFDTARIRTLPAGSIVITSEAPEVDAAVDVMAAEGQLKTRELLRGPDGTPTFWILELSG